MEEILKSLEEKIKSVTNMNELNDLRVEYLGKKGSITVLSSKMSELSIEEKKSYGAKLNELKNSATSLIDEKKNELETKALNEKLAKESIDISLPATTIPTGAPNILEKVIEEV